MTPLCLFLALVSPVWGSLKDLAYCDPLRKDMSCPPDPAYGGKASFNFSSSTTWDALLADWSADNDTMTHRNRISFHDGRGAAFTVSREHEAPTLISNKYMLFGKVTAVMAAATGRGLITAMVLKSDSGDEIDWELLGAYDDQASSNYFYDGQALFNTYNTTYTLRNASLYHSYTVEWTDKFLAFSIDGSVRRAWRLGDIPPDKWPQTPMQVKLGVWAVARDSDKGEIAWAGGLPDWNEPHTAYVKTLEMTDYAGYCDDIRAADAEYQYDERTVGWQDVRIAGCKRRSGTPLQTPRPATPSATDESGGAAAVVSWFLAAAAWLVAF